MARNFNATTIDYQRGTIIHEGFHHIFVRLLTHYEAIITTSDDATANCELLRQHPQGPDQRLAAQVAEETLGDVVTPPR